MVRIEDFKPQLKPGKFIPQVDKLIYEVENPTDQIVLPIELADFLFQCNGEFTLAEIIENIYRTRGFVHFKTIVKTLRQLKQYGFLINGNELVDDQAQKNWLTFFNIPKYFDIPLFKRVYNDKRFPAVFYVAAVLIIVPGLIAIPNTLNRAGAFKVASPSWTTLFSFIFLFSLLLTAKNLLKLVLQVLLSGRSYNINLRSAGPGLQLYSSNDSLFLVNDQLYLWLYHLATFLSPLLAAEALHQTIGSNSVTNTLFAAMWLALIFEGNPFEKGELARVANRLLGKENSIEMMSADDHQPLAVFMVMHLTEAKHKITKAVYLSYCFLWTAGIASLCVIWLKSISAHYGRTHSTLGLTALLAIGAMFGFCLTVQLINMFKLAKVSLAKTVGKYRSAIGKGTDASAAIPFEAGQLQSVLPQLPLFSELSTELLNLIIQKSSLIEVPKGSVLIEQGQQGHELYVLLSGQLDVLKQTSSSTHERVSTLLPITVFGEMAIVENSRRAASVIAAKESFVFSTPAKVLRQIAIESHHVRELDAFRSSILVSQYFASAPLFRELNPKLIPIFLQRGQIEHFEPKQTVFREGDYGDGFYLLLRGSCSVHVNGKEVSQIKQGGFFGEISLIADVPRTGTVQTVNAVSLLKVNRETFWEVLAKDLRLALIIEEVGRHRIWQDIEELKGKNAKVA